LVVAGEDDLSLQEVGEFFDEGVVLNGEAFGVGDEVVVRQHGRYRREQADGGGNQRFGDARRDAGDAGGHRQILSGIAEWYPDPSIFVGKKVVIVANLKPRKMRGQISQGMILSAEKDGVLQVVFAPEGMPNGSTVA